MLDDIIVRSYPSVTDHEKIDDCMKKIMDYSEDSIPVLSQDGHMLGVITSEDIVEMVDNEMGKTTQNWPVSLPKKISKKPLYKA